MTFDELRLIFNRALKYSFNLRKNAVVFGVLSLAGLLFVFFRSLSIGAGRWLSLSLTFLPIFLGAGLLLSLGVFLIRMYHDEIKGKPIGIKALFSKSWDVILGSSYFSIPIVLLYLILWMILGIFVLLSEIPLLGPFFYAILAFGPFLINFLSLVLCILSGALLFFVAPSIALRGLNALKLSQTLTARFKEDAFTNIFLAIVGFLPFALMLFFLMLAAEMSGKLAFNPPQYPAFAALQWFFMMIPFAALLAPAVTFFFNFSAEAHVMMKNRLKSEPNPQK